MTSRELIVELKKYLPAELAEDLVNEFISIRADVATETLERTAPGKFVETVIQILQHFAGGTYSRSFKSGEVEDFLRNTEARQIGLPQDLKIVVTRVARGMYSLRSKRGIVHKGGVEPNIFDLRYLYAAAQWILCEITCHALSTNIETARSLVEFIQVPASSLVEDFGDKRLVLRAGTAADELLILLWHYYPVPILPSQLHKDMNRRARPTVSNAVTAAYRGRLIEGNREVGYKLTTLGYGRALGLVKEVTMSLGQGNI
jgi:hypothetical protein